MISIKNFIPYLGLLCVWVLVILIINPIGDFPLNDDWSYAKSVKTLMDEGSLKLYNWGEMTLVAHVYFGYLFTKIFGFSFTVLRFSTLLTGLFSIWGIYAVSKLIQPSKCIAFFVTLICLFNPIFLSLSFSFMTDVPFFCLNVWGFYFFIRFHRTEKFTFLFLATFFCLWALFIRQLAFVLPLSWMISYLFSKSINRKNILTAVFPFLCLLGAYFIYTTLMKESGLLQARYNDKLHLLFSTISNANAKLLINIPGYFFVILAYIGLLLAPLHIPTFFSLKTFWRLVSIIYTIIISSILIYSGKTIPCLDNVWIDFGIGPTTLFDFYGQFTKSPGLSASKWLLWALTIVGVFFSFTWLVKIKLFLASLTQCNTKTEQTFGFISAFIYLFPFLVVGIYDRYLVFLFPIAILLLLPNKIFRIKAAPLKIGVVFFLLCLSIFSTAALHDYLSWNRLRWKVLSQLNNSGISNKEIQGGVEYTAWYQYSDDDPRWWEKVNDNYILVFSPLPNCIILKEYNYNRWLPGSNRLFLVQRKSPE